MHNPKQCRLDHRLRTRCRCPDTGVRALVGDAQVAVFRISQWDQMFAIDAVDPFSNAPVLSAASWRRQGTTRRRVPIYKQHFSLHTGECLEDEAVAVRTFDARVLDGHVQVRRFSSEGFPSRSLLLPRSFPRGALFLRGETPRAAVFLRGETPRAPWLRALPCCSDGATRIQFASPTRPLPSGSTPPAATVRSVAPSKWVSMRSASR